MKSFGFLAKMEGINIKIATGIYVRCTERFSPKGVSFNASVNHACNEIVEIASGDFLEIEWDKDVPACTILNKDANKVEMLIH